MKKKGKEMAQQEEAAPHVSRTLLPALSPKAVDKFVDKAHGQRQTIVFEPFKLFCLFFERQGCVFYCPLPAILRDVEAYSHYSKSDRSLTYSGQCLRGVDSVHFLNRWAYVACSAIGAQCDECDLTGEFL